MLKHATAIALLAAAGQGHALTLGAAQGQVVIGRPLELVVMAGAGASDAAVGQCLQAEVHYGDSRLPAAAVTVTPLAPDRSGAVRWRVRASQPVNEPIVTLQMRVGCANSYSRSYALLADQDSAALPPPRRPELVARSRARAVSDDAPARSVAQPKAAVQGGRLAAPARQHRPSAAAPGRSAVRPAPINLPPPRPRPSGVERVLAKTRPAPVPEQPVELAAVEQPVAKPATLAAPVAPATTGPRLELDLIETGANAAMPFQLAGSGSAAGAGSPLGPAVAAPVKSERPMPMAATGSLQAELAGLRAEQARMRAAVEAVHAQLAQARRPRWQDPLVLGLLALSAASLGALAWTWIRLGRQRWA